MGDIEMINGQVEAATSINEHCENYQKKIGNTSMIIQY